MHVHCILILHIALFRRLLFIENIQEKKLAGRKMARDWNGEEGGGIFNRLGGRVEAIFPLIEG